MGSTSPQIRGFITTAYAYSVQRTERNLTQLQRQLQILSVVSGLNIFEPTCMENLEFYVCLEQLLTGADAKSPLAWKVITLLTHISRSATIRVALRDEIQLLPVLSDYLIDTKLNNDKSQKTLQLLQDISYGVKIKHIEAWMLRLIPYLASLILESDGRSEILVAALATLNNLCRGNPPSVSCLRKFENIKKFLQSLTRHKNASLRLQLLTSEVMIFIEVDLSRLNDENIFPTIDLLFTAAVDGFVDNDLQMLQLAADVLDEFVSHRVLEIIVRRYKEFNTRTRVLQNYINSNNNETAVAILFSFLSHIVKMEHPDVKPLIEDLLTRVLPWLFNKHCGINAIQIIELLINNGEDNIFSAHIDEFILAMKEALLLDDNMKVTNLQLQRINGTLKLLETLLLKDQAFKLKLSVMLSPSSFSSLINPLLEDSKSKSDGYESMELGSTYESIKKDTMDGFRSSESFISRYTNKSESSDASSNEPWSISQSHDNLCSETIIRIITVIKLMGTQKPEFLLQHSQLLTNIEVLNHIVRGEQSKDHEVVARAVSILSSGTVPVESLPSLVKTRLNSNESFKPIVDNHSGNAVNVASNYASVAKYSEATSKKVDDTIARLKGTVEKTELRDLPLIDIMEMYEYKLATLAHEENNLHDALTSANIQTRQKHHTILQARAENDRLHTLLQVWEIKVNEERTVKSKLEVNITKIQNSACQLRDNFVKDTTAKERELASKHSEIINIKQELENKNEDLRKSHRQLSESHVEIKSMNKQIKDIQDKAAKLGDTIQKLEEDQRKGRREQEDKQKDIHRLEKSIVQSKSENSELELLVRSHEQTLVEKDNQIDELTKTNASLKQIQDMIHNISAGKMKR